MNTIDKDINTQNSSEITRDRIIESITRMKSVSKGLVFSGVTHKEFFMLEILSRFMENNPDKKGVCVSELAARINTSMPHTSRLLKTMEEKNFINRIVDEADRRNTYVSVTDVGRLKRKCVKGEMDNYMNIVISRMGRENIDTLINLIGQMADIMKDEQDKKKGE